MKATTHDTISIDAKHAAHGDRSPSPAGVPVTHSILCGEALREEVTRGYAIDAPGVCRLIMPGVNDTYLLSSGDQRYVARVYKAHWRTESEIGYELELLAHLAARGVPVSTPIADRDGSFIRPLPMPEGTRRLVLFTHAPGTSMWWDNVQHCHLAGRLLGRIHLASDDFTAGHERFHLDLDYLLDDALAAVTPFLSHRPPDQAYIGGMAVELRARAEVAIHDGLDWGVCHGDFHSENIHIADNTPIVFDFDFCAPGWRAYDLFEADRRAVSEGNRGIWESFLSGYTEFRPFGEADIAAVRMFRAIRYIWSIGQSAKKVGRWGLSRMSDDYLDRKLRALHQWEAERPGG